MGLFISNSIIKAASAQPPVAVPQPIPEPQVPNNESYYGWFTRRVGEIAGQVSDAATHRIVDMIVEEDVPPPAPAESWADLGKRATNAALAAVQEDPNSESSFVIVARKVGSASAQIASAVSDYATSKLVDMVVEEDEKPEELSWATHKAINWCLSSLCTDKTRDDLRIWLGSSQIEQISSGLAHLLQPLFKTLTDEQREQIVTIMLHSLAKKSLKDGKASLSDMILTLTNILKKHAPQIQVKASEMGSRYDLTQNAYTLMNPLARDLMEALLPPKEELLPLKGVLGPVYRWAFGSADADEGLMDMIAAKIANKSTLDFVLDTMKVLDNKDNRQSLAAESLSILEKLDAAAEPSVAYMHKRVSAHHQTISDELFLQFGFGGSALKGWWDAQVKDMIESEDGAGKELLTFASYLLRQTLTNAFVKMGGSNQQVGKNAVEMFLDIVKFAVRNEEQLWNLDPNADNRELFKSVSALLIDKLHLADGETLPFPAFLRPHVLNLLKNQLPQILALSYAKGVLPEIKQMAVAPPELHDNIEPTVHNFSMQAGKFAGHFLFKAFLPTDDGNQTVSKGIVESVSTNPEYSAYIPHDKNFWSKALTSITNSAHTAENLQRWTQMYATHSTQSLLQTILDRIVKAESNPSFNARFKESAVQILGTYINERGTVPVVGERERLELLKSISHLLKGIIALEPSDIPLPLQLQDSLWDSWIPQALDQCLVKFFDPKYLKQKLASSIAGMNMTEDEFEKVVERFRPRPELVRQSDDLLAGIKQQVRDILTSSKSNKEKIGACHKLLVLKNTDLINLLKNHRASSDLKKKSTEHLSLIFSGIKSELENSKSGKLEQCERGLNKNLKAIKDLIARNLPTPELETLCAQLLKNTALFADLPLAKQAVQMGLRDKGGYEFIIALLYGVLGKQVMNQLNNYDLSAVLVTSLDAAINSGALRTDAPVVKEPELDLAEEIMKKVDEALIAKMDSFIRRIRRGITDFLVKWLGGFGIAISTLLKGVQVALNILLAPLVWVLKIAKEIAYWFIQRKIRFTLDKMDKTFDVTLMDRILADLNLKLNEHVAAPVA